MAGTNFLERFRPLGAPGAATVGAQASDDLGSAAELAPVFAALAPTVAERETIVAAAHHEADAHLVHARERAAAIRARARADVGAEQARAAARVLEESTARDAATLEAAAAAAAETRRTGTLRVDALADAVLGHLLSDVLGEP